jgi:hypothetical protein
MSVVNPPSTVREDDPIRVLLPVGLPVMMLLVIGAIFPLVVAVLLGLAMFSATLVVGYVLIRFVRKFINENCGPGGILEAWRPTLGGGLRTALGVLVRWAPFGFLSLLVFGANGLIVSWIAQLLELGIVSLRGSVGDLAAETAELGEGWSLLLPASLEDAARLATAGLNSVGDLLANLLVLIRFLLVVEGFIAWVFLIWLTTRSSLYFLARTVLAERGARDTAESSPIEVRFNMEFLQ